MSEMIPLSANIFHEKGDLKARVRAAIDIVIECMPEVFTGVQLEQLREMAMTVQGCLAPASYDVRAEYIAALRGDDTAPPAQATDGGKPYYVVIDTETNKASVFDNIEQAMAAKEHLQTFAVFEQRMNNEDFVRAMLA